MAYKLARAFRINTEIYFSDILPRIARGEPIEPLLPNLWGREVKDVV
jgi:hypothetical protein